ncbi:MAG: hypothetical protein GX567_12030 [Clostridia bacterium]|nr:hypothetical protein [Clostridia bacterium]
MKKATMKTVNHVRTTKRAGGGERPVPVRYDGRSLLSLRLNDRAYSRPVSTDGFPPLPETIYLFWCMLYQVVTRVTDNTMTSS